MGEYPREREAEWAQDVQGVAHDDNNWYITQSGTLWRIPKGVDLSNAKRGVPGVGTVEIGNVEGLRDNYNHFGDLDYYYDKYSRKGYLLVPIEGKHTSHSSFRGDPPVDLQGLCFGRFKECSLCAISPQGIVYISNTNEEGHVSTFDVDWIALGKGVFGWLKPKETLSLLDENGSPVYIDTPQGGAVSQDGRLLYIVAGLLRV